MQFIKSLKDRLFNLRSEEFESLALEVFRYQATHNQVYQSYLNYLNVNPYSITEIPRIPFLPIEFFKTMRVSSTPAPAAVVFESSGTTGQQVSRHYVADPGFYYRVARQIFTRFYGPLEQYHLLALLPSYLERNTSSLIYMVEDFMQNTSPESGFYLHNREQLKTKIAYLQQKPGKILLIGVTFALLDFAEEVAGNLDLSEAIVMETGGMKGRRKELLREEVHQLLKKALNCKQIHSEYGMTELLSQCYASRDGYFTAPPWVKILLRDISDPFDAGTHLKDGGINIVDLANIDSCAFIETKDIGRFSPDKVTFQVLGRYDNSEVRGCNLMVAG